MPITTKQREERKNHLGSSDVPALMGYSRFATPWDVWAEKTGRITPAASTPEYALTGELFEDGVLKWAQTHGGLLTLLRNQYRVAKDLPLACHIDAIEVDTGIPVEAKVLGVYGPMVDEWGDPSTDDVPEYIAIQAHCHMIATEQQLCHVPTFFGGGRGFGMFFVKRDEGLVKLIREQVVAFWDGCVLANVAPNAAPSPNVVKRIRRIEDPNPVTIPDDLVKQWQETKDLKNQWEKQNEEAKARIRAILDGRSYGTCGLGAITDFVQNRKGFVVEATSYPVLRLKEKK